MSRTERQGIPTPVADLPGMIGTEVGVSRWITVDQARIDAFAETTEDRQFIHIDPEAAARTPFGGTIAHGFLTLSLLSAMTYDAVPPLEGVVMGVNYGFDKLRFLAPVPAGSKVRGRFKLLSAEDKGGGRWLLKHEVTVEIQAAEKPALIAEWLGMQVVGG
jgi:acyl dehydratase